MCEIGKNYMYKRQLNLNATTTIMKKIKKLNKQLITKINKLWVNFLFPPSYYLQPGSPFKNLNGGRVKHVDISFKIFMQCTSDAFLSDTAETTSKLQRILQSDWLSYSLFIAR